MMSKHCIYIIEWCSQIFLNLDLLSHFLTFTMVVPEASPRETIIYIVKATSRWDNSGIAGYSIF